jgi:hypothetical protein
LKPVLKLLVFTTLLLALSCQKDDADPGPDPDPIPAKKMYLKKIVFDNMDGDPTYVRLMEYDNENRLTRILGARTGNTPLLLYTFFYDGQGRLTENRMYGNAFSPTVLVEIRKYSYDAAGNCTGDTAFNEQLFRTYYWDNAYTFDSQGRMLTKKHANDNIFRYEYGTGKNPVKAYMHFYGKPELERTIYNKFDDKKTWMGESATLRLYFRTYASMYTEDFFANNPVDYKQTTSTIDGVTIYERADVQEVLQYNANGYPVKREVVYTTPNAGTRTVFKQEFEYEEK